MESCQKQLSYAEMAIIGGVLTGNIEVSPEIMQMIKKDKTDQEILLEHHLKNLIEHYCPLKKTCQKNCNTEG